MSIVFRKLLKRARISLLWSISETQNSRLTGFIAREWNCPSAARLVSMAVVVDLMISLRPVERKQMWSWYTLSVQASDGTKQHLKPTCDFLLRSYVVILSLSSIGIHWCERGGESGGVGGKKGREIWETSSLYTPASSPAHPNDIIISNTNL